MKIAYLTKRWDHHTQSGGYDQLSISTAGKNFSRSGKGSIINRTLRYIWRKVSTPNKNLVGYNSEDWLAECKLAIYSIIKKPEIIHVLYGDEQLDLTLDIKKITKSKLVATFHLPTERDCVKNRFEKNDKNIINLVDSVVVVATSQIPDFQRWFGLNRVFFIPHGINTKIFSPPKIRIKKNIIKLICVGDHMRDFEAVHCIMDECQRLGLPVRLDLVTPKDKSDLFYGCKNISYYNNISESKLIELYQQADALLMPVSGATANNAILESLACGTPVISTNTGGITDYLDDSSGWIYSGNVVKKIVDLLKDESVNNNILISKRDGARGKSLQYDWNIIRELTNELYKKLYDR